MKKLKITLLYILVIVVTIQNVKAQITDFSGIIDGQQICADASAITLTANNDTSGIFYGNGIENNNDGTAIFEPNSLDTGLYDIRYEVVIDKFISIAAGSNRSIAIKPDSSLWAWGNNGFGSLGDGTTANTVRRSPIPIGEDNDWAKIESGFQHTLAIKYDGTLWSCGTNDYGQLGDGTTSSKNKMIQIGNDNDWIEIAAGSYHNLAIKSDGTLWAWGRNKDGQLGDSTLSDSYIPIKIGIENNWKNIACGHEHSLAIKTDYSLWAWGDNFSGKLGDGTSTQRLSPVKIGTDNNWVEIAAGAYHSLARKSNRTLWGWGYNSQGQVGNGSYVAENTPRQVGTQSNWVKIDVGSNASFSFALKSNGTIWTWGTNTYGQLGDGTTDKSNIPTQVGTDNNWMDIAAGSSHSLALKSSGALWAWGRNDLGAVGDGTSTNRTLPVLISTIEESIKTISIEPVPDVDAPIDVNACENYSLPDLEEGNYYTETEGAGTLLNAGDNITSTQSLYVYASNETCSAENSFTITIDTPILADAPSNISSCDSYILPNLTIGNYYTETDGAGTMLNEDDTITSTQTLFVFASNGTCNDENSFDITITTTPEADAPSDISSCESYTLPNLNEGNYYTETGGSGSMFNAGDNISSTQTLYVFASNGTCTDENSFMINIDAPITVDAPSNVSNCNSYVLPYLITGNYYTGTNGTGTTLYAGDTITQSQELYIYEMNGVCSDQNSFIITINSISNTVELNNATLSAVESDAVYQWLDCNNEKEAINGANSQNYTPTESGSYAVEIVKNECIDTSICMMVDIASISENSFGDKLIFYPNPTDGQLTIQLGDFVHSDVTVTARNLIGQEIMQRNFTSTNKFHLNIEGERGVYLVEITTSDKKAILKVIKK